MKEKNLLEIQTNPENAQHGGTIERLRIKKTPFYAVGNDENGYHIILGNNRLTEHEIETIEEVDKYIEENVWIIIGQLIAIMIPQVLKDINQNQNNEQ